MSKKEKQPENIKCGHYRKDDSIPWLKDSEIERIFSCRRKAADLTDIYKILYEAGFEEMDPQIEYDDLSIYEKRKRYKILKVQEISGNVLYNDENLICPICSHKYVAYNIFDIGYPFIDCEKEVEGIQPLSYADEHSIHKYYCLNCGSDFGIKHDPEKVFSFGRGAFFSGTLEYDIWEMPDYMLFRGRSLNDFCDMRDYCFRFPKEGMQQLLGSLKKTARWRESYECKDEIDDGYGWDIKCDYGGVKVNSGGYEAFPFRFFTTMRRIQKAIENLCRKYADDYSDDRIEERLSL